MQPIFLDHSSTTPIAASVRESMLPFLNNLYGHPASDHWTGRAAAEAIEDARSHVAGLLDCHPNEIVFTSGGTESVNLGLLGVARAIGQSTNSPHCIISNLEHSAVKQTAARLTKEGWKVSVVRCDTHGRVPPDSLESLINAQTRLISITHGSYQLGTIQPIEDISKLCYDRDVLFHTDAAQTVGKIPCMVQQLGVDMLSLSGHKFFAPKGIGALFIRLGVPIEPILYGEGSEAGLRPGTPNVSHIVALGQAAKLAQAGLQSSQQRVTKLRECFLNNLESLLGQPIKQLCYDNDRLPGVTLIELPGVTAADLQQRLPDLCLGLFQQRHSKQKISSDDVFQCLGLTSERISRIMRISIGWTTTEDELQQAAHRIAAAYDSLLGSQ